MKSAYAGVPRRWLIIFSEKAYEREMKTFRKNLEKNLAKKKKELKHLCNTSYACAGDADKAGSFPDSISWYIEGSLSHDESSIETDR